jgi:hypothetical protein
LRRRFWLPFNGAVVALGRVDMPYIFINYPQAITTSAGCLTECALVCTFFNTMCWVRNNLLHSHRMDGLLSDSAHFCSLIFASSAIETADGRSDYIVVGDSV